MSEIRVIICDDEQLARAYLQSLLQLETDCRIVAECRDVDEAIDAIERLAPDLIFLDIQMPGQSGLEVIEEIGHDEMPYTVFVTAHDRYAIPAFERQALDYLLKPFSEERFRETMRRVRARLSERRDAHWAGQLREMLAGNAPALESPRKHLEIIPVRVGTKTVLLRTTEIEWIEAADCYVNLRRGKEQFLHREAMRTMESRLDPRKFVRVHRRAIVNIDFIRELRTSESGTVHVILKDGTSIPLGRRRKKDVERVLGG